MNPIREVFDVDTHITEPRDLWTKRLPRKWVDVAPQVLWSADQQEDFWYVGGRRVGGAWKSAMAGWPEFPPSHPRTQGDIDPASYDPEVRLERMTEHGITAQVLYPNLLWFRIRAFLAFGDPAFHTACVKAYNDFAAEFARADANRLVPLMVLPLWDLEECRRELARCIGLGHKGVVFPPEPEVVGLPRLRSPHWYSLWEQLEHHGLPVNFHIGYGDGKPQLARQPVSDSTSQLREMMWEQEAASSIEDVHQTTIRLLSNATTISELICTGICERFPKLQFVSTESGFGYIPYLLDMLDWQWVGLGGQRAAPGRLLPSEYFRRQISVTFWFEHRTLRRMVDLYPNNLMFETDFPHPSCIAPGATSQSGSAQELLQKNLVEIPPEITRRIVFENAAEIYHVSGG